MKSRRFFCFLTLLLAPLVTLHAASHVPSRPNIIILLADDLGYADLGCQGSKEVITPNIDSIAANGVRCTAGYVTAPQCCPSRAGLMTGRYQNHFGFEANPPPSVEPKVGLPVSERTLADRMKAAGYTTGMIGKWHLGRTEPMRPYNRGFDETFWHPSGAVLFPDPKTGFIRELYRGPNPVQESVFWRFRFPHVNPGRYRWAMRQGDWKLVKNGEESLGLYNLVSDIGEAKDLSDEQPERRCRPSRNLICF